MNERIGYEILRGRSTNNERLFVVEGDRSHAQAYADKETQMLVGRKVTIFGTAPAH